MELFVLSAIGEEKDGVMMPLLIRQSSKDMNAGTDISIINMNEHTYSLTCFIGT